MRAIVASMLSLAIVLVGQTARADEVKRALFVLGIHLGNGEGVATEFVGDPPAQKPGAIALIKRSVKDSFDVAEKLKLPSAGLKTLLDEVDRLSFAEMAKRLGDLRLEIQSAAAKTINPGAGAFFIMGVHQSGAERLATGAAGFARKDKPGTEALIERQLLRMADGAPIIKVTVKTVLDIQANMAKGATFAELASQLEKLRLAWQDELGAQPGFGGGVVGKALLSITDKLTANDPKDAVRKDMHAKIHTIDLKAGQVVIIDLESGDGTATNGFFDTYLRVEDKPGNTIAFNDDGGMNLNSRLEFTAPKDGTYRLVVTTYRAGETGPYTLTVRPK